MCSSDSVSLVNNKTGLYWNRCSHSASHASAHFPVHHRGNFPRGREAPRETAETVLPLHHHIHPTRMDTKFSHTHSLLNTLSEGSDPCLDGEELGWSEQPFFRATGGTYFFGAPSSPQDDGLDHHFQMDKFAYVREVRFNHSSHLVLHAPPMQGCLPSPLPMPTEAVASRKTVRRATPTRPPTNGSLAWPAPRFGGVGMLCVPDVHASRLLCSRDSRRGAIHASSCHSPCFLPPSPAPLISHSPLCFFHQTFSSSLSAGFGIETPTTVDAHFARA